MADERETQAIPNNERLADTQQPSSATPPPGSLVPPMDPNANTAAHPIVSDNERLINTLQECFNNLLKEQKEQAARMCQGIEELKLKPPPTTDKKTAFWNTYKTLADEHDKELLQKYSTDLDTSLIFAGLFSAVDSAFIIQIQPEFQTSGPSPGPSLITLVAQSLLYVSLGSTLLAALLAVLGKQWLIYYSAAGERGTIETRGLERQRKLDGLQKWKFETIMKTFPLLLQFALFLFAAALSVYLQKIHDVLAFIALGLTSFGTVVYILLLASAMAFQDSPFRTPLASFVVHLVPKSLRRKSIDALKWIAKLCRDLPGCIHATCSPYIYGSLDLLPRFTSKQQTNSPKPEKPSQLFNTSDLQPSSEVSAVSWVLETSTDPVMLSQAADVTIELQWPNTMDVQPHLNRLRENFLACFDYLDWDGVVFNLLQIRDGMDARAIQLGRAYHTLSCVSQLSPKPAIDEVGFEKCHSELRNIICIFSSRYSQLPLVVDESVNMQWLLHVLPLCSYSRDASSSYLKQFLVQLDCITLNLNRLGFSDYLFCINALLGDDGNQSDLVYMDKSKAQKQIFERLLAAIISNLKSNHISMDFAAKIIRTTHRLASNSKDNKAWNIDEDDRQSMIYQFCGQLPQSDGWVQVVLATGLLTSNLGSTPEKFSAHQTSASWVYEVLKSISAEDAVKWDSETEAGVAGLLLVLYYYGAPLLKDHVQVIVQVLLTADKNPTKESNLSRNAGLLLLQTNLENWFQDPDLEPLLQEASIWTRFITQWIPQARNYDMDQKGILLGHMLSELPSWQLYIHQDLCSWITLYFKSRFDLAEKYNFVLTKIWQPDINGYTFTDSDEEALGLTYAALSQVWREFDFSSSEALEKVTSWLHCSKSVLLWEDYFARRARERVELHLGPIKVVEFTNIFLLPLQNSLVQAAAAARHEITEPSLSGNDELSRIRTEILNHVGKILDDLASKMPIPTDPEKGWLYWAELQDQFGQEIDKLEELFGKLTLSKESASVG